MSDDVTVNIDMGRKCVECGKPGATDSGICLKCTVTAFGDKPMSSRQGIAVQARLRKVKAGK